MKDVPASGRLTNRFLKMKFMSPICVRKYLPLNKNIAIKMEIRGFPIKYSKNKAKKRKSAEIYFQNIKINELYKKAGKHHNKKQIINEIYYARSRLKNMQHKTKGTILRSKVRWHEHGERNTRYLIFWLRKTKL